jgi:para-nitrobenzyl esterase
MQTTHSRRNPRTALCAALTALTLATTTAPAIGTNVAAAASSSDGAPIVTTNDGAVRGVAVPGGYAFWGLPYAAPPTGNMRWRAPRPPAHWEGVRDATNFGPSCPQPPTPVLPPGPISEDCLYLNVSTPTVPNSDQGSNDQGALPVLVWIHGGGLVWDGGRDYDGTRLAAEGLVVVTINYRLGALGFLAHPALASRPGGPSGNYGLMDQQAALRWVQANIGRFGGDPHKVTLAGESAGGLSVLAQLVSRGSRGLFQRAIVESGSFALTQQSLPSAEAAGEAFAAKAGCPDQTAECLRQLPVAALLSNFPIAAIPGIVDGKVLTEAIGTALAAGRFARVPVLNGTNHDEERWFVAEGLTLSGGSVVFIPEPVTADSYQPVIASVLGVSAERAAAVAAEYPPGAYPSPVVAFSALVGDANFACPALQIDRWTSPRVATFAYEFNDDAAPQVFVPPGLVAPPVAAHASELGYLFDLPNAPFPAPLSADQQALAASMRAAWANFAASGNPASTAIPWPAFDGANSAQMLSLVPPEPQVETDFASRHHCSFWAAG